MRETTAARAARCAQYLLALALASTASGALAQQPRGAEPRGTQPSGAPSDAQASDAPPSGREPSDAATSDTATSDAATSEAATSDAAPSDAATSEAATSDAAPSDAQPSDTEPSDTEPSDAQPTDADPSDEAAGTDGMTDPEASQEPSPPEWRWPGAVVWEVSLRLAVPAQTGFDRALVSHGYGDVRLLPGVVTGFALPAGVEWLWLGGQLGVRGRTWSHGEREDASLVAVDLLAMARLRFLLGDRVELGAAVGGGLGWVGVWVNGVMRDQLLPRFNVQGELAFRIGRHVAIGPRVGWDYFQVEGANGYGHSVEAGGPYFGLSLEGRE